MTGNGRHPAGATETATERLVRLLAMVPWLLRRQGIDIHRAAAQFGVSSQQIVQDLELLFLCGTPGGYHDDLIDASWENDRVYLSNADTIARPLRLGRDEALALIVALRALDAHPGISDHDTIDRALAKLEATAGESAGGLTQVSIDLAANPQEQAHLTALRGAITARRRVHLRYLVLARDETTERDVDPMRVLNVDGRWYLEGWCHRARDVRLFRLDRVEGLAVLDEDGTPPEQARPLPVTKGVFRPGPDDRLVELELSPSATWVAENYPTESREDLPDGTVRITLRAADTRWVARLVWRLGGSAVVLGPPDLVSAVREGAAAALAWTDPPSTVD